LLKHNIIKPLC